MIKKTTLYKLLPLVIGLVLAVILAVIIVITINYRRDREDVFVAYEPEPESELPSLQITDPMDTFRWDYGTDCSFEEELPSWDKGAVMTFGGAPQGYASARSITARVMHYWTFDYEILEASVSGRI